MPSFGESSGDLESIHSEVSLLRQISLEQLRACVLVTALVDVITKVFLETFTLLALPNYARPNISSLLKARLPQSPNKAAQYGQAEA